MSISKKTREIVRNKYNNKCAYCGCELDNNWQVDHVIPQVRKLQSYHDLTSHDDIENLLPACHSCNNYKGGHNLTEFRELVSGLFNKPQYLFQSKTKMNIATRHGGLILPKWDRLFYFEK